MSDCLTWSDGRLDGERILKLTGPFTISSLFEFQDAMRTDRPSITIVDLTDVEYMDSAALGSLLTLHVSSQQHGRQYAVIGASDRLQTLFRVSGAGFILATYPSLADAEASLAGKAASV